MQLNTKIQQKKFQSQRENKPRFFKRTKRCGPHTVVYKTIYSPQSSSSFGPRDTL